MTIKTQLIGQKIYFNVSLGRGQQTKVSTPLEIDPLTWDNKTKLPKNYITNKNGKQIKEHIDNVYELLRIQYNTDINNGTILNKHWIKEVIDGYFNKSNDDTLFTSYIQLYINDSPYRQTQLGVGTSEGRIKELKRFKRMWLRFENDTNSQYHLIHINKRVSEEFTKWLRVQKYSDNYISKNLNIVQSVMRESDKKYDAELSINPSHINAPRVGKRPIEEIIYLSFDELKMIQKANIKTKYLQNARKWLIMGCYVGQRGGDLLSITEKNITTYNGKKCIVLRQQKTKKDTVIPILPEVEKIINSGFPTKISIEKFREYIKEVCRLAKIDNPTIGRVKEESRGATTKCILPKWKLVSTHICRRSFSTNFYGTIPTPILMRITNHSSEKQFLAYIGKPDYSQALEIFNYL